MFGNLRVGDIFCASVCWFCAACCGFCFN